MEQKFCNSCAMPMQEGTDMYGTEADGSKSNDYCSYCYQDGKFVQDCTMQEMIDICVEPMVQSDPNMTEEKARNMMNGFFPTMKRWAK